MKPGQHKFLVELLNGLSKKQLFFIGWAVMVGGFVMMMLSFYKKRTRSNFRGPQDGPVPYRIDVDSRRLGEGTDGKKVAGGPEGTPRGKG